MSREADGKSDMYRLDHVEETVKLPAYHSHHIAAQTDTYDIDEDALGINLPPKYYWSSGFIGTVTVSLILLAHFALSMNLFHTSSWT